MIPFKPLGLVSAGLLSAYLIGGCDLQSSAPQTLVVDPIPVAKSLGRDALIKRRLDAAIEEINAQLRQHNANLAAQVEQEKEKLGKNPSDESTAKFQELVTAASQSIQQTQLQAKQKATDYRAALLREFNAELRVAAAEVAAERGARQVLILDDSVLWYADATDITADVIARLRTKGAQPAPVEQTENLDQSEVEQLEKLVDALEQQDETAVDTR